MANNPNASGGRGKQRKRPVRLRDQQAERKRARAERTSKA